MQMEQAVEYVKPHLTKARFEHTLRVAETAVDLAERFGVSREKVELAAIFHDYAKYRPLEEMEDYIKKSELPDNLLTYHHELWHGPVAALLIEKEFNIHDADIKGAIRYHTTGRANMKDIEKVVFIADYIEPGRNFPGVEEVREVVLSDLNLACWMALRNTIEFLVKKKATIYPDTFHAYNDLTRYVNGGNR
ncbi:bis(5'-nucleosyl)-tetraphosphatase (symmetrical) YqeK [Virgibacillus halodenitrificans]|uniref:bis(5'-nucleosyl)-tetraphosphatase (symmetrical) YqeK n=1 Tax=Virgibacillus halodenitrificans TaxID=1482 RepID=UPI002DBC0CF9|nr:bis(5'-nucleosyl)-tetraphosphatase (symmetrical) YqeK [Virgibacillus halodenitrificans]MEC2160030.1 bis(5'-nucleosyl)-tetraphosphatase (symmetrical) YqeK [Virgibacillus halodenitrificans]